MSDTVHYTGQLVKIDKNGAKNIDELARILVEERHKQAFERSCEETELDFILYDMPKEYYVDFDSDEIYEIKNLSEVDPYADIYKAKRNGDDSVSFEVRFYNGGRNMQEALEEALANIEEESR